MSYTRRREQWVMNGGSTMMHLLGWRRRYVAECRGKEVIREADINHGGRKRWRRPCGEKRGVWKMIEGIRNRGEQPPTGYGQNEEGCQ